MDPQRVALGIAILLADRMERDLGVRGSPAVGTAGAFAVGVTSVGLDLAGQTVRLASRAASRSASFVAGVGRTVARQPVAGRALAPVRTLGHTLAEGARSNVQRGQAVVATARSDATAFLELETANGMAWLRSTVMPTVIDDLVADPKVRELALSQAHGALTDTARVLRARSAGADARLEAGARRLFGARNSRGAGPNGNA